MMTPIQISWHFSQIHPLPVLEFFGVVNSCSIDVSQCMYLQLAISMINIVENYGGIISEPMDKVPLGPNIFFTAYFESYDSIETFLDGIGAERMG